MFGKFEDYAAVFIEITSLDHGHGGEGWEFGTCLWSPERSKDGRDIYSPMREMKAGDLVIHFLEDAWPDGSHDRRIEGYSTIAGKVELRTDEPPLPGIWSGQQIYFRVPLEDHVSFPINVKVDDFTELFSRELREDAESGIKSRPFAKKHDGSFTTRQGGYVNRCSEPLFRAICVANSIDVEKPAGPSAPFATNPSTEYEEAKRTFSERSGFARNPRLASDAKAHYGLDCAICGFNFEEKYGTLGSGYIECHHIIPLGQRKVEITAKTRLEDVEVVCANCHRMLHRIRPALTPVQLRAKIADPFDDELR